MKRSIEKQIYKELTKEQAEKMAKLIVDEKKTRAEEYAKEMSDNNTGVYPFTVGALQVELAEILRQSKVPVWIVEKYLDEFKGK